MSLIDLILRRVYVRGSLRNTPAGVAFNLRNGIAAFAISGFRLTRLNLAGREIPLGQVAIFLNGRPWPVDTGSGANIGVGDVIEVLAAGVGLPAGITALSFSFITPETGEIQANLADQLQA